MLLLSLAMLIGTAACGNTATTTPADEGDAGTEDNAGTEDDGKVYTMRIGAISTPPTPEAVFIVELEEYIKEATGGRVVVEAYHSGTLGTTTQMIQGLQDGSVDGVCVPTSYYEPYVPELGVIGLPMFFKDAEQAYRFCSTPGNGFHEKLDELFEAKGFVVGCWANGANSTLISTKPVAKYEDFNGLKIWCLPNARIVDTLNLLGAVPVNFDTGDLAVGIQQKTVDAAYTGPQLFAPQKLQDTAKNLFVFSTPLNFNVQSLICSKIFIDSLPPDLRALLLESLGRAGTEIYSPLSSGNIERSLQTLKDAEGMTVVYSDDDFTAKAKAALAPTTENFLNDVPAARELYDLAVALIQAEE
jgi:TRAP-type C4-dicarboxylate transport system substrate-binding protein